MDIVASQIKIAAGASLADLGMATQADVPPINGFSIQCRVTSEDPEQNFQVHEERGGAKEGTGETRVGTGNCEEGDLAATVTVPEEGPGSSFLSCLHPHHVPLPSPLSLPSLSSLSPA